MRTAKDLLKAAEDKEPSVAKSALIPAAGVGALIHGTHEIDRRFHRRDTASDIERLRRAVAIGDEYSERHAKSMLNEAEYNLRRNLNPAAWHGSIASKTIPLMAGMGLLGAGVGMYRANAHRQEKILKALSGEKKEASLTVPQPRAEKPPTEGPPPELPPVTPGVGKNSLDETKKPKPLPVTSWQKMGLSKIPKS